jgi:magnesium chelatase subunit H
LLPIPVFINGVEGHTVVRDLFTSERETRQRLRRRYELPSLSFDAVRVDAVVNTIGFPLVGGPAGSMEGGRQTEAAREILETKGVPYLVAAPLLIQDLASWRKSGVQGLQTVVLYSLPELDGATDTVVLGGLVGEKIAVLPERVRKLAARIKARVALSREPETTRKLAVLLYGFPPNVGAVGTAALLNVARSLEVLFSRLGEEGYDLGRTHKSLEEPQREISSTRSDSGSGSGKSSSSARISSGSSSSSSHANSGKNRQNGVPDGETLVALLRFLSLDSVSSAGAALAQSLLDTAVEDGVIGVRAHIHTIL